MSTRRGGSCLPFELIAEGIGQPSKMLSRAPHGAASVLRTSREPVSITYRSRLASFWHNLAHGPGSSANNKDIDENGFF